MKLKQITSKPQPERANCENGSIYDGASDRSIFCKTRLSHMFPDSLTYIGHFSHQPITYSLSLSYNTATTA